MSQAKFENIAIRGVSAAVPRQQRSNADIVGHNVEKTAATVGVKNRYIASDDICTSDLCFEAADKLLNDLEWERDTVDAIIFLSQTPDYVLPATSCLLQDRLGLSSNCAAFDMSLGCSGYVYGLMVAHSLIQKEGIKRVLLLVGDTISKVLSPHDAPANILFGDAGTATALEYSGCAQTAYFNLGTDGSGAGSLIIEAGGFRKPKNNNTKIRSPHAKDKVLRSEEELFMDGSPVFSFTIKRVPESFKNILNYSGYSKEKINYWLFHQANKFMLDYLSNKCGIEQEKMVINMHDFGNTSPPSIPLLMTSGGIENTLRHSHCKLGMLGFGVGLSWGAAIVNVYDMVIPELIFVDSDAKEQIYAVAN